MSVALDSDDDALQQQQAFIDFMLGSASRRRARVSDSPQVAAIQIPRSITTPLSSSQRVVKGGFPTIARGFRSALVHEWLDADDNIHRVLCSISNLRELIYAISRKLEALSTVDHPESRQEQTEDEGKSLVSSSSSSSTSTCHWRSKGYRGPLHPHGLARNDLELAMTGTLVQHEKMLAGARQLMLRMGQTQDALGRRFDELWLLHNYYSQLMQERQHLEAVLAQQKDIHPTWTNLTRQVDECEELFRATSRELFRKQMLAQTVFDSLHDALVFRSDDSSGHAQARDVVKEDPVRCAWRCARQWPSSHKSSYLYHFRPTLEKWRLECGD
jgi:hypothetical protein